MVCSIWAPVLSVQTKGLVERHPKYTIEKAPNNQHVNELMVKTQVLKQIKVNSSIKIIYIKLCLRPKYHVMHYNKHIWQQSTSIHGFLQKSSHSCLGFKQRNNSNSEHLFLNVTNAIIHF